MTDKNKFLITASVMLSLAGTGLAGEVADNSIKEPVNMIAEVRANMIYETKEWKELEEKWDSMDKVKVSDFQEISDKVKKEQEELQKTCNPLVKDGYLSSLSVKAIKLIYGENLRATLEKTVLLPTCYSPVPIYEWDLKGIDTRNELKKKLDLLEDCYKKQTIKKDVYETVKKDISNRLSLLHRADKYWEGKGEGNCEKHPKEVDLLLHFYDENTGGIKDGKDVFSDLIDASVYIIKLEN